MRRLQSLIDAGVSVWLDDLGRHRIASGELAQLVGEVGVSGVTTNPSIFAAAVRAGTEYQAELASSATDADTTLHDLMVRDVRDACRVLTDTFHRTDGVDGHASLEVDPRLAFDTDGSIAAAAELWQAVGEPNLMVKIPATEAGLTAIEESLAAGISINVTLIFGVDRYRQVQQAWLRGLERAQADGHDLSRIESVASFFVSRLDSAVDQALDRLRAGGELDPDRHRALRGRAAIANARNAYRIFCRARTDERWQALEAAGAHPQRPLWASTSTKDPAYSPTRYVDELVAPGVVNTMPTHTLSAVLETATEERQVIDLGEAATAVDTALFDELSALGIHYDEVVADLEKAGVDAFIGAWASLAELVGEAQQKAG